MFDKFQHLLQLQNSFVISPGLADTFQIVMFTKNDAKKVVKLSNHSQFVAFRFLPDCIENTVYSILDFPVLPGKMMVDQNLLMDDLLHISRTDRIML